MLSVFRIYPCLFVPLRPATRKTLRHGSKKMETSVQGFSIYERRRYLSESLESEQIFKLQKTTAMFFSIFPPLSSEGYLSFLSKEIIW